MTNPEKPALDERAQFEEWAQTCGLPVDRQMHGFYEVDTQFAWQAWQARAALPADKTDAVGVSAGWKLVPVEPTREMIEAGWIDKEDVNPDDIWGAMLAAAPSPAPAAVDARDLILADPHNDIEKTVVVVRAAYDWTIDEHGRLWGLVAGDMGYAPTHIVLPQGEWMPNPEAAHPAPQPEPAGDLAARPRLDRLCLVHCGERCVCGRPEELSGHAPYTPITVSNRTTVKPEPAADLVERAREFMAAGMRVVPGPEDLAAFAEQERAAEKTRADAAEAELRRTDPNYTPLLDKYASDIQAYADRVEATEKALEFVALWAWREDPPNATASLTDAERLSAIKHHPAIRTRGGQS